MTEIINDVDNSSNLNSNNNNSNIPSAKIQLFNFDNDESQGVREENIRALVSDCRKELIDGIEDCYGSWALINYLEYFLKMLSV